MDEERKAAFVDRMRLYRERKARGELPVKAVFVGRPPDPLQKRKDAAKRKAAELAKREKKWTSVVRRVEIEPVQATVTTEDMQARWDRILSFSFPAIREYYKAITSAPDDPGYLFAMRHTAKNDLFFLLTMVLRRPDAYNEWVFNRCREVQRNPDGYLDLWSREFYKSSVITFALTIFDILNNPELTIAIFSHTRPAAKKFLRQIKQEFEENKFLQQLFPDVLYENPSKEAPKHSEDDGIIVKRSGNPKESTLEAWGLVDGQPAGPHWDIIIYDDTVTKASVGTTEMIEKTNEMWELSLPLSKVGGKRRYVGTRYNYNDSYKLIMDRGAAIPRIYPCTKNGEPDGEPVFMSREELDKRYREWGSRTFYCHAAGTEILMQDFTTKLIENILVNDVVIGFSFEDGKTRLKETPVLAVGNWEKGVRKYSFESGKEVTCTPDHKWWTGRCESPRDHHSEWVGLGSGQYRDLKGLVKLFTPPPDMPMEPDIIRAASYLGGIFDGEGSYSGLSIHLHQTEGRNSIVCQGIIECLEILGFDYGITRSDRSSKGWANALDIYLRGGKQEKLRFLRWCQPYKSKYLLKGMCNTGNGSYNHKDKLVRIGDEYITDVFNIQTGTGTLIANGYASHNCQMLLNPKGDDQRGFKKEHLKYWDAENLSGLNTYLLCDPAGERKKRSGHSPDYTVFILIGYGSDKNWYLIDMVRDRIGLVERGDVLFDWHRRYRPMFVGYEKFGKDGDIEHYKDRMNRENYRFEIKALHSNIPKIDRIDNGLRPKFEAGQIYIPDSLLYTNAEGQERNLIEDFINEEYLAFPVSQHDDILDCLSMIDYPDVPKWTPSGSSEPFVPNRVHLAINNSGKSGGWVPNRKSISRGRAWG